MNSELLDDLNTIALHMLEAQLPEDIHPVTCAHCNGLLTGVANTKTGQLGFWCSNCLSGGPVDKAVSTDAESGEIVAYGDGIPDEIKPEIAAKIKEHRSHTIKDYPINPLTGRRELPPRSRG